MLPDSAAGGASLMGSELDAFISYLSDDLHKSDNTVQSYRRDLVRFENYLASVSVVTVSDVTEDNLKAYLGFLESEKFKTATISRNVASVHAYFRYLYTGNRIPNDISGVLKSPKVEKKLPEILTPAQVASLLEQPSGTDAKEVRDKAMLELLYATGIRVSELIGLKVGDVDIKTDLLVVKDRKIPFGVNARNALIGYFAGARDELLEAGDKNSDILFPSCLGEPMSRQGFWKLLKGYAHKAGIEQEITPHTLRHCFAAHLMAGGADIHSVSEMLGHSDISTTKLYSKLGHSDLREVYSSSHPRA